jgi:phosphate-selective porin OprO/OprP
MTAGWFSSNVASGCVSIAAKNRQSGREAAASSWKSGLTVVSFQIHSLIFDPARRVHGRRLYGEFFMKGNANNQQKSLPAFVLTATAAALLASFAGNARAEDAPTTADLDQRIKVLERQLEIQKEEADAKAKDSAVVSANDKGFAFKSANGDYEFKFRGLLQADERYFLDDKTPRFNDTGVLRRVEPTFELTLGKIGFLRVQPQFNGDTASTSDVYGELRLLPQFYVRAGKFKEPVVLENLQPTGNIEFIERSLVNEIGPNRDIGVQVGGDLLGGRLNYAFGYFNGAPDGRDALASDVDNRKELAARLFTEPFKNDPGLLQGLGFGIGASTGPKNQSVNALTAAAASTADGFNPNNYLPRYRSPGQNQVFAYRTFSAAVAATGTTAAKPASTGVYADGTETRISPQAYYYYNSFGLLTEYIVSEQDVTIDASSDKLKNKAWQVYASYVLTGEDASYRGVKVRNAFKIGGPGWGAFEIGARYNELKIDSDAFPIYANPTSAISKESGWAAGVNWYLNNNLRVEVNYTDTKFDGGGGGTTAAPIDREDEKAVFGRFQVFF